jgi:hypothetical protein
MTKFNETKQPLVKKTETFEHGQGYTQRPEFEFIGLLSTGIQAHFYEAESDREVRLKSLIDILASKNKEFVAKALVYARTVFGQRTVTHLGAVDLLPYLRGDSLGKRFFGKRDRNLNKGGIIRRLDDMTEILACYMAKNGINKGKDSKWTMPKSMKMGFKPLKTAMHIL